MSVLQNDISDYWDELIGNMEAEAVQDSIYPLTAFFNEIKDILIDANCFTDLNEENYDFKSKSRAYKSMKINGGYIDPSDNSINLLLLDYDNTELSTITNEKQTTAFNLMLNFVKNCCLNFFRENNLQSDPIYPFVNQLIHALTLSDNINLFFVSTNIMSDRLEPFGTNSIELSDRTINVHTFIYDIRALYTNVVKARPNIPIKIDVLSYLPKGIKCLKADLVNSKYEACLAVLPGAFLSDIYKDYGGRLLENNVRSFLSTRGSVNKGIRSTIWTCPDKFFTFNNGIACTADSIKIEQKTDGLYITELDDFQIINGGQTTASLRNAILTDKEHLVDLKQIFVSMKLTVISSTLNQLEKEIMVQDISKYSNTQNKVTSSDLNSNSKMFIQLEQLSRKVPAPLLEGRTIQTYWYFERSRGQYERDQMEMTKSQRRHFQELNPKSQVMRIVDIAKYYNAVIQKPYEVSWGGQVNASAFLKNVEKDKISTDSSLINEWFFKKLVAEAILYNTTKRLISNTEWYKAHSGILAQLVPYTISKLNYEVTNRLSKSIDWKSIWLKQAVPTVIQNELLVLGKWVYDSLSNPNREKDNLGEWAKLERCWNGISNSPYTLSKETIDTLVDVCDQKAEELSAKKQSKANQAVDDGLLIFNLGLNYWSDLYSIGKRNGQLFGQADSDIQAAIQSCSKNRLLPGIIAKRVISIKNRLEKDGFLSVSPINSNSD